MRTHRAIVVSHGGAHVLKLSAERYRRLVRYYPQLQTVFDGSDGRTEHSSKVGDPVRSGASDWPPEPA